MILMKRPNLLRFFWGAAVALIGTVQAGEAMQAKSSNLRATDAVIVYGSQAKWANRYAAGELAKYLSSLTCKNIKIVKDSDLKMGGGKNLILIGNSKANKITRSLEDRGVFNLSKILPEGDGFIIKTVKDGKRNYLILAGKNDIGTLYSVYGYLKTFCEIGFFQDGDYIPYQPKIPFGGINVVSIPRFDDRMHNLFGHWGMKKYQAQFWNFEDFRKLLDWMTKNRLNMLFFNMDVLENLSGTLFEEAFPEAGPRSREKHLECEYPKSWNWPPEYRTDQLKKILEYGRRRGIRFAYFFSYAHVTFEYKEAHPEIKYIDDPFPLIHPDDPMAEKVHKRLVKKCIEMYGTDHYYMYTPYGERAIGSDPIKDKTNAALQLCRIYKKIDPKAVWITDTWDFGMFPDLWTEATVKRYLEKMPDMTYLYDTNADMGSKPLYKKFDYFYGKKWAFGILNAYAWEDEIYGDVWDIAERLKRLAKDSKAKNCTGVIICPELLNYNTMYRQLLTRLAWNPGSVDVNRFLTDYTVRRYGRKSADNMVGCTKKLALAMKHRWPGYPCDVILPSPIPRIYQKIWDLHVETENNYAGRLAHLKKTIPLLREALEIALSEKDRQKSNKLYENDLFEIARLYIGEVSDFYLSRLYFNFKNKEKEKFEKSARKINLCLNWLEKLLSTRKDYSLEDTIEQVMAVKGTNPHTPELIRWTSCAGGDYLTNANLEQLHYYYRPQVNAYIEELRQRFGNGPHAYEEAQEGLRKRLEKIKDRYLQLPSIRVDDRFRFKGTALEAVEAAYRELSSIN